MYNKWTGKTGKCKEIMYRKSARERRGKGEERGTDTSTTDKLDILLPIRIQIDEGLEICGSNGSLILVLNMCAR